MKRRCRLFLLVGIGVLLVLAALAYVYFVYARPVGSGPAGRQPPHEAFAKPWTDRKVLLLGLGDSVTAGFGVDPSYSYFNRMVRNPEDEFEDMRGICLSVVLPNLQAKNLAMSGSTSLMHLETIRNSLETQDADTFGLIVMTTGGNDLIHNYGRTPPREGAMYGATFEQARPWIDSFVKRLDEMIATLEARFPGGCMIFMADIYDPSDGVGDAPIRLSARLARLHGDSSRLQCGDPSLRRQAPVGPRRSHARRVPWARHPLHPNVAEPLSVRRSALLVRIEPGRSERARL